jgi:4-amino-4-deoxy-L-arabinose transferase-like glycosyltransferase
MAHVVTSFAERPAVSVNEPTAVKPARRQYLIALLASALVIRLVVLGLGAKQGVYYPDEIEYIELAQNLAVHNEFSYKGQLTSFRPPGFAFILSLTFRLFGEASLIPARLVNILFSLATVGVIYRLGKDGWGERVGLIAAAIFAFYPTLIGYTNILLTETSCIFFVALFCWTLLRCLQQPHWGWAVASGVALGMSALIRDTLFYAGPVVINFLAFYAWRVRRFHFKYVGVLAAGFLLAILPWCVRNSLLNGRPTLISSVGGVTFYVCNNEKAPLIRSSSLFFEKPIGKEEHYYYETLLPELNGLSETEKHEMATRKAFEYIVANPGPTFIRMLGRLVDFWGQERLVINHVLSGYYGAVSPAVLLMIIAVVFAGYSLTIFGACFNCFFAKWRALEVIGLLFIAYYTVMHLLVFAHPRYHMPLLPIIVVMAARAFAARAEIMQKWKTWQFAGAAALAAGFVMIWAIGLFVFDAEYVKMLMQRL